MPSWIENERDTLSGVYLPREGKEEERTLPVNIEDIKHGALFDAHLERNKEESRANLSHGARKFLPTIELSQFSPEISTS